MEKFTFELTVEEAAVIAAECSLSLSDGRCREPESRANLERIISKLSEPFGFELDVLRNISDAIVAMKRQSVHIN